MNKEKKPCFIAKMLKRLSSGLLKRNRKFKNIHEGESCYIFGNGASLKYYDLNKFKDKISIGCNMLFLHKDFDKLDVRYYYEGFTFFYYPFWKNPVSGKYEENIYGKFHKKKILLNKELNFFLSLSNYFGIKNNNIYYAHHFDEAFLGYESCMLDSSFTAMDSALSGMIGLAIYMGFKDITLVGCDYTFSPQVSGHFYEYNQHVETFTDTPANKIFLQAAVEKVNLRTVVPSENQSSNILDTVNYEALTGAKPIYRENNTILSNDDLLVLNNTGVNYRIFK